MQEDFDFFIYNTNKKYSTHDDDFSLRKNIFVVYLLIANSVCILFALPIKVYQSFISRNFNFLPENNFHCCIRFKH